MNVARASIEKHTKCVLSTIREHTKKIRVCAISNLFLEIFELLINFKIIPHQLVGFPNFQQYSRFVLVVFPTDMKC